MRRAPAFLVAILVCASTADGETPPIAIRAGPHLFLDDRLIESCPGVARRINVPKRDLPGPVVTGPEDGNFQPFFTVLRDPATKRFRMWYGTPVNEKQSHFGYIESEDGVRWIRPHRVLDDPAPGRVRFCTSVTDRGPNFADAARRYVLGWHWEPPRAEGGLMVAFSPDGLTWTPLSKEPVLLHNHDINNLFWDPIRKRWIATVSMYIPGAGWTGRRRITHQSESADLEHWSPIHPILAPDAKDEGETEFYAMGGHLARGDALIGMVKVLRDEVRADDPPDPPDQHGVGYTALAWSYDGLTWTRDREPFLDRVPEKGAWDHAHAWVDSTLLVDDTLFIYYAGYARGHKVERFKERQIGLVSIPRDRYVAREAEEGGGTLRTRLVTLEAGAMTVNADAKDGEVRVQITDADGKALPGFAFADGERVAGAAVAAPVRWKRPLDELKYRPVRLEFALRRARLFGFDLAQSEK